MNVLSIGYGRHLFVADNPERRRMELCAKAAGTYSMIVFTYRSDGFEVVNTDTGLTIYPTNARNRVDMLLKAFLIARKLIKQNLNHVVITTQDAFEPGLVGLILKKVYGVYLTVQEHADVFITKHWRQESFLNQLRYLVGTYVLKKADTVRVVAERIKNTLIKKGVSPERITQLPVAIDIDNFTNATTNRELLNMFPEDAFVFLSVSRFVTQKNFPLMIRAFAQVYRQSPRARLLIVGTGEEESHLHFLIQKNFPNLEPKDYPIQILPWTENVADLMCSCDAYVLSSNYEGWARVLIEAIVCNLPIVTTDVGCANEVVKNMEHGFVVPVGDCDALAMAMEKLVSTDAQYLSFKNNLKKLDKSTLPGANISSYGQQWVYSLKHL